MTRIICDNWTCKHNYRNWCDQSSIRIAMANRAAVLCLSYEYTKPLATGRKEPEQDGSK